jgi:hypothetical protein
MEAISLINLLGPKSLSLIVERDLAGNSSLMTSVLQKRDGLTSDFWQYIKESKSMYV